MHISFCTWVKDRKDQIIEALTRNIAVTEGDSEVSFHVVDVASEDGVEDWFKRQNDPRIVYRKIQDRPLHFPELYNEAHREAHGELVVSLDADNFLGPSYCHTLRQSYILFPSGFVMHCWDGRDDSGLCGRIAMPRELFERLGGYDEDLEPVGFQDLDLVDRARAMCGNFICTVDSAVVGGAIQNTAEQRMQKTSMTVEDYEHMNSVNRQRSRMNVQAGRLVANQPV